MKYIRTKDGRIGEITSWNERHNQFFCKINGEMFGDNNIVVENQANAIEELCDKWVFDNKFDEKNVTKDIDYLSFETINEMIGKGLITNVRLAIWTDKGLIYVAKINEKGELELL